MKNLIPILTYILELPKEILIQTRLYKIELYADFLNQDLTDDYEANGVKTNGLNRFVACMPEGKLLKKPSGNRWINNPERWGTSIENPEWTEYVAAENRILFKSTLVVGHDLTSIRIGDVIIFWKYTKKEDSLWTITPDFCKIEHLIKLSPELTTTAQKLIGVSPN